VSAGVRRSALDEAAAPDGLWFPIDLASDPALGGMVATNTGGARMLRHGDVRRRLLGLEAVVADDELSVLDDLTTLRKDNTGPGPSSWFVGSCGALGVVTRVAVELEHLPVERACALIAPSGPAATLRVLRAVESGLGPLLSAFEVMSHAATEAALDTVDGLHRPFPGPLPELVVLAEADGPIGTADILERVVAALADGDVADAVLAPPEEAWALRHSITEGLARRGVVVGFDVSVPRSELVGFRADARRLVADALPRATVADFGHWGDGGVHCNLVFPADAPPDGSERALARQLVFGCAVDDHRGSYSAEHGIGPHNADWWRRVTPAANRRAIRTLRDRFDPDRVLGHPGLPF
jgi:FAD/FMN-containing dehydrogenase